MIKFNNLIKKMKLIKYLKLIPLVLILIFTLGIISSSKSQIVPRAKVGKFIDYQKYTLSSKLVSDFTLRIPLNYPDTKKVYTSEIKQPNFEFSALTMEWEEKIPELTNAEIQIRFLENENWTSYSIVEHDQDGRTTLSPLDKKYAFFALNNVQAFQYQIILQTKDPKISPEISNLEFTYLRSKNKKEEINQKNQGNYNFKIAGLNLGKDKPQIISRKAWGADESLRVYKGDQNKKPIEYLLASDKEFKEKYKDELQYEKIIETNSKNELLTWPLEYPAEIKKIIIHHTATTKDLDNPKEAIRNIYYYHTITRGFGDIGYNYVIDQTGKIYEGRAGGPRVVGGHTESYNHGSVGIAVLGNFENQDPPYPVTKSLIELLNYLTKEYKISPNKSSQFRGEMLPNIIGHRDAGQTSCPGINLYRMIPEIRSILANYKSETNNSTTNKDYNFEEATVRLVQGMNPQTKENIKIILKNTGTKIWDKNTYLLANKNPKNSQIEFVNKESTKIASLKEEKVEPGQKGHFEFDIQSELKSGLVNFELTPMINGNVKTDKYILLPIYVKAPILSYKIISMDSPPKTVKKSQKLKTIIELQNTGNITWYKDGEYPFRLGTDDPKDHPSIFDSQKNNRLGIIQQDKVAPGEIAKIVINYTAPSQPGSYKELLTPVIDGISWLDHQGIVLEAMIQGNKYAAEITDTDKNNEFTPSEKRQVWVKIKNTGNAKLYKTGPNKVKISVLKKKNIIVSPATLDKDIKPGEEAYLKFYITAPKPEGDYSILLTPMTKNNRLIKKAINFKFKVTKNPENSYQEENDITEKGGLIRIKLTYEGNPEISANGDFKLEVDNQIKDSYTIDDKVSIEYQNNKYIVKHGDKAFAFDNYPRFIPKKKSILQIYNMDRRPSWNKTLNDNQFRGNLEVRYVDNKLEVINELPLEDYLNGLGEVPNGTHIEKHKTIIVAARTYAKFYMDKGVKFPGKPYHGSDDPAIFQKYVGYSLEIRSPNVVKAADETRGEVVTYKGELVKTPYFSQSDGRTRSAEEVFGWTNTPYLISVPDPYCEGLTLKGHGVGLSGCGTDAAANNGKTYKEILKYYYTGIEI